MKKLVIRKGGKMAGAIYTDCGQHIGAITGFRSIDPKTGRNNSTFKLRFFNGTDIDMNNYGYQNDVADDAVELYAIDNFENNKSFTVIEK